METSAFWGMETESLLGAGGSGDCVILRGSRDCVILGRV